jgi:hypothetical protein
MIKKIFIDQSILFFRLKFVEYLKIFFFLERYYLNYLFYKFKNLEKTINVVLIQKKIQIIKKDLRIN